MTFLGVGELLSRSDSDKQSRADVRRPAWWVSLVGAIGVLWWTLWPTLSAPFGMADDHMIIDMTAPSGRLSWSRLPHVASQLTSEHDGRFRPLYWAGQAFEAALWGRHSTMWYVDRLVLATVTLVCLYVLLTHLVHPVLAALIALLPFWGPQVETWTRLGPNEAYAMPLTAGGLALVLIPALRGRASPGSARAGYLLLALAGLAKESFLPIGPCLCLLMVAVAWPRLRRRDWVVVGMVAGVAAVDLAVLVAKVRAYGELYPQARTAATVARFLGRFVKYETFSGALPIVLILVVVLYRASQPRAVKPAVFVAGGLVLLVVPQTYLNAGTSPEGRYLYPLVLLVVLLWAYAGWLAQQTSRPGRITALLAVVLALPLAIGSTYGRSVAAENTTTATEFQATLHRVESEAVASHARTVVIEPSDPFWDYEPVGSYAAYLKAAGYQVATLPAALLPNERSSRYIRGLARDIDGWSARGTADLIPLDQAQRPCVSLVWAQSARHCPISVEGYDPRPADH